MFTGITDRDFEHRTIQEDSTMPKAVAALAGDDLDH